MNGQEPHPVCILAAADLQSRLSTLDIGHNFGLPGNPAGPIIGKMFGVLVVRNADDQLGYLSAFSGKMAGGNHHEGFVPPVFDSLTENSFLNNGMKELTRINDEIRVMDTRLSSEGTDVADTGAGFHELGLLRLRRKQHSTALQQQLFNHYYFLDAMGRSKSLNEIFEAAGYKNPPSGAGECAGPKLLQYAFRHQYQPVALTEFWWGQSPKSDYWKHKQHYPCCKEKCEPILGFMLDPFN